MFLEARVRPALTPITAAMAFVIAAAAVMPSVADAQTRSNAQAEQSRSLRDRVFGRNLPAAGQYASDSGQGFVLDRSGSRPLLRFDRSSEIWALRPSAAPRGDVIYRNDAGDQVLRVTPDGGMTLYTRAQPGGVPVSMVGPASPLTLPSISPAQLASHMIRQSSLVSRAVGHLVIVDAEIETPGIMPVVAETISITSDSIARMARSENLRRQAQQVRRILVVEGARSQITFSQGTLRIMVDPRQGLAGRPSSVRIVRAIAAAA
jgi:hypothetical protein